MSSPREVVTRPRPFSAEPIPTLAACHIDRQRLNASLERLTRGHERLLCVWGPAGSGKTMLLANWARRLRSAGEDVDWLSGADPAVRSWLDTVASRTDDDRDSAASHRLRYVFIDDAHLISNAAERSALTRLAEAVPDGTRLILAGRFQPFRTMTFLQAIGAMLEIRASDLAFDRSETERLATRHRLDLPAVPLDLLVQRTGGWATGLALAMPWLLSSPDPARAVGRFDGDNRAVADYLVSEIVEALDEEDRRVLMAVAVRELIPLPLAVELGRRPDTGAILQRLSRRNTLIVQEEDSFRYHPILLSFMQAEARRRDIFEAAGNHIAAARWFARRADGAAALEQALLSRTSDPVVEMLEKFGVELILVGKTELVGRALNSLRGEPESTVTLVLRLMLDAPYFPDPRRAWHLMTTAKRGPIRPHERVTAWDHLLTILQCFLAEDDHGLTTSLVALVDGPIQAARSDDLSLDLLAASAEGWCLARLDRAHDAVETFRAVAQTAHGAGYDWLFLLATDLAATAAASMGDWLEADTLESQLSVIVADREQPLDRASARALYVSAVRAYQRCEDLPVPVIERIAAADPLGSDLGLLVPARALLLAPRLDTDSNPRQALESLGRLMWAEADRHPRVLASCCVRIADLTNRLEGRAQAREVIDLVRSSLGADSLEAQLLRFLLSPPTHARENSEETLEAAVIQPERAWHLTTIVHSWIALADLAEKTDRPTEADSRLAKALRFAERFRLERVFIARNGVGAELVSSRIGRLGHLDGYARRIQECADRIIPARADAGTVGSALTPRERELLRELPMHQTVADIAGKLSLSANTVKTHLRSIYQKLGASDRAEAVLIAHARGLV